MIIAKDIQEKLEDLGVTSRDIAIKLTKLKCIGVQNSPTYCPLAKYLKLCFGKVCTVARTAVFVTVSNVGNVIKCSLNAEQIDFVEKFDDDFFPGLIDRDHGY